MYLIDMVDLCIIIYILGQSLHSLTSTENYGQHKMAGGSTCTSVVYKVINNTIHRIYIGNFFLTRGVLP